MDASVGQLGLRRGCPFFFRSDGNTHLRHESPATPPAQPLRQAHQGTCGETRKLTARGPIREHSPCPSMSAGWRMLFPSYAPEVAVVAGLLILVALRWRFERRCLASVLRYAQTRRGLEVDPLLAPIEFGPMEQLHRMVAIAAASIVFKGEPTDMESFLSVADECLQYIRGDEARMPRPDTLSKGRIPR